MNEALDKLALALPDPGRLGRGEGPQVVFPSALELDREAENQLVAWCQRRYNTLVDQTGRDHVDETDYEFTKMTAAAEASRRVVNSGLDLGSYLPIPKAYLCDLLYNNDLAWRRHLVADVFVNHNVTLPVTRRILQQQISRASNYFFATDPWFTLAPQGKSDVEMADTLEHFARHKFAKGMVKDAMKQAIKGAFIRGTSVLKTAYKEVWNHHQTFETIALMPDGQPALTTGGDYIYKRDKWIQPTPPPTFDAQGVEIPAEPDPMAPLVHQLDPTTTLKSILPPGAPPVPDSIIFEKRRIRRRTRQFAGVDLSPVYYRDLLVPPTAQDIQSADFVAHLYDEAAGEMVDRELARLEKVNDKSSDETPEERLKRIAVLVDLIKGRGNNSGAAANASRPNEAPQNEDTTYRDESVVLVGEFYVWANVGNGVMESIVVKMDIQNWRPIRYDYCANWTPDGLRPFHVVRINPEENRWWGRSAIELYWQLQHFLDFQVNRLIALIKKCDTTVLFDRERTTEGQANPLTPPIGSVLTPTGGVVNLSEILQKVDFYNPGIAQLMENIELIQQHMMNLSGVANANDMNAAGLDTAKLATGVRNIESAGQEQFAPVLGDLEPGLASAATAALQLIVANMDDVEAYEFLEGDTQALATVRRDDIANLSLDVCMEMTRYRGEQQVVQMTQAVQVVEQFYGQALEVQEKTKHFFQRILKSMEIQDAKEVIQAGIWSAQMPVAPEAGMPPGPDRTMATQAPQTPPPPLNI